MFLGIASAFPFHTLVEISEEGNLKLVVAWFIVHKEEVHSGLLVSGGVLVGGDSTWGKKYVPKKKNTGSMIDSSSTVLCRLYLSARLPHSGPMKSCTTGSTPCMRPTWRTDRPRYVRYTE